MALQDNFSASDYDTLAEIRQTLMECSQDIQKAEQCGLDCQARKEALAALQARIDAYLVVLFPNGRPQR